MSPSKLSLSPFAPPSATLAHINRLLSTTAGQDKVFMLYASRVIVKVLKSRSVATKTRVDLANRIGKLGSVISDARVLYRLFGLFPIIAWLQSLYHPSTPLDPTISTIEKLQAWSMIFYCPLEHASYLASKGVLPIKAKTADRLSMWSSRFWAVYVVLQFAHIRRSSTLLHLQRSSLLSSQGTTEKPPSTRSKEVAELEMAAQKLHNDFWIQCGFLPLTLHWSLPNGLIPNEFWVGVCGVFAGSFGMQNLWRASA